MFALSRASPARIGRSSRPVRVPVRVRLPALLAGCGPVRVRSCCRVRSGCAGGGAALFAGCARVASVRVRSRCRVCSGCSGEGAVSLPGAGGWRLRRAPFPLPAPSRNWGLRPQAPRPPGPWSSGLFGGVRGGVGGVGWSSGERVVRGGGWREAGMVAVLVPCRAVAGAPPPAPLMRGRRGGRVSAVGAEVRGGMFRRPVVAGQGMVLRCGVGRSIGPWSPGLPGGVRGRSGRGGVRGSGACGVGDGVKPGWLRCSCGAVPWRGLRPLHPWCVDEGVVARQRMALRCGAGCSAGLCSRVSGGVDVQCGAPACGRGSVDGAEV